MLEEAEADDNELKPKHALSGIIGATVAAILITAAAGATIYYFRDRIVIKAKGAAVGLVARLRGMGSDPTDEQREAIAAEIDAVIAQVQEMREIIRAIPRTAARRLAIAAASARATPPFPLPHHHAAADITRTETPIPPDDSGTETSETSTPELNPKQ